MNLQSAPIGDPIRVEMLFSSVVSRRRFPDNDLLVSLFDKEGLKGPSGSGDIQRLERASSDQPNGTRGSAMSP